MNNGIIKTLTNVRFVPYLKIEESYLCWYPWGSWCKYTIEGENLKVSKGALVLMKANKFESLYVLQGPIVTVFVAMSLCMSESKVTKL